MSYIISCCTASDMEKERYEAHDIRYLSLHYSLDGVSYDDDLGQSLSYREFYDRIRAGADTSTSQASVGEYVDYFRPMLEGGSDVIHACLSSGISSTFQSAQTAAEMLRAEFPERKLYVVDSLCASAGFGMFTVLMALKRDEGMTIDELYDWAQAHRTDVLHWFCSTDLTYFIKGGRISKMSGVIGGIFEICPLMNVTPDGRLQPMQKIRTKKKVLTALVDKMEQHAFGGLRYSGPCYISHSDCLEDALSVKRQVMERFKYVTDVPISYIGGTIGAHTGTGTVALYFLGDEREDI